MNEISTAELRGFLAVANNGHLSAAADELGLNQPTLSRQIQRVEKRAGASLFERAGRGMTLNARGRAFLPHAEAMLSEWSEATAKVARLMDPERGTVRLDFMHSLGTWMVPDLLRDYRAEYRQVDFQLHQDAARRLIDRVLMDASDLALVGPKPPEADTTLGWHQLKLQNMAIAIPEGHPLAAAAPDPISLEQVAAEPFIGMYPGYGTRLLLDRIMGELGNTPHLVFESMELSTVAGLVSAGLGVALLPLDDPYLAPVGFVLRPLDPPVHRELGMVWRVQAQPAPPVDQFRDFVRAFGCF